MSKSIHVVPNDGPGKKYTNGEPPEIVYDEYPTCGISTQYGNHQIIKCGPFAGNLRISGTLTAGNAINATNTINSATSVTAPLIKGGEVVDNKGNILSKKKNLPFDMKHPTKPGWRLRHVCLEGPEIGVYLHGKNQGNVIELPDYWRGLVKEETISVVLTPIGYPHVLYIKSIDNNKVYVESNAPAGTELEYNYVIHASRYDDDLIVEYEGESHLDYPGGNEGYSFNYEHNYVENLIKETIKNHLDSE